MNVQWYFITSESLCNSSIAVSFAMVPAEDRRMGVSSSSSSSSRSPSSTAALLSFMMRMADRMSRARWWYNFLIHSTSDLSASNPFNSLTWMMMECITLTIQILITAYALAVSKLKGETPISPIRIWVSGYAFGCILCLMLLCWRYFLVFHHNRPGDNAFSAPPPNSDDTQHHTTIEESRFGSFHRAPKLHVLCIILLAWNALTYSLPFILFVLLCCCVPLFSSILGYMGSIHHPGPGGASDDRLSTLPTWKYNQVGSCNIDSTNSGFHQECCICLASYSEKEEIRQLPCSHIFHLKCVDQWLRIISSCPLCKKELER
ncbi:E3 ubiquitin-protein ligase At4g11680-like isoform X2 [Ipomoea triloba]|uniref:E3 ubiquitin-protein ligase At4g11680-like isoform X2 n=1 Tax=Ipomoea triloba TaxID=35885 RepID=UPI00125E1F22|nr:E3 ubiquitin-protein ligase At4g11680-like isoform X2 [Ipomoea triloba]